MRYRTRNIRGKCCSNQPSPHLGSSHSQQRVNIHIIILSLPLPLLLLAALAAAAVTRLSIAAAAVRVTRRAAAVGLRLPLLSCRRTAEVLWQLLCRLAGLGELHQLLHVPGSPGWCTQGVQQL